MLAVILLSAVVEARSRYRAPSPAKKEQIVAREAGQIAKIDTERANFETLKAEHEKTQAAFMAAQAKFEHEQNQLHLLRQYTSELTELQKEAEQNAEKIDAVVQKIKALNLASIQEATHEVKVAQAEVVHAAQDAGQPVPAEVTQASVQVDQAFVEAAHAATEGGAPAEMGTPSVSAESEALTVAATMNTPEQSSEALVKETVPAEQALIAPVEAAAPTAVAEVAPPAAPITEAVPVESVATPDVVAAS